MSSSTANTTMEAIMIVESEESVSFPDTQRIVPDDSDSTPNSSHSSSRASSSSRRAAHKSKAVRRTVSWGNKKARATSYRSLDQKKQVRKNTARRLKQEHMLRAIKTRVDREEGVTPQKLHYLEQLARQNERERIRQELMVERMSAMENRIQMMLGLLQHSDFVFDLDL